MAQVVSLADTSSRASHANLLAKASWRSQDISHMPTHPLVGIFVSGRQPVKFNRGPAEPY